MHALYAQNLLLLMLERECQLCTEVRDALQMTVLHMLESLSYVQEARWWLEMHPWFPGLPLLHLRLAISLAHYLLAMVCCRRHHMARLTAFQ